MYWCRYNDIWQIVYFLIIEMGKSTYETFYSTDNFEIQRGILHTTKTIVKSGIFGKTRIKLNEADPYLRYIVFIFANLVIYTNMKVPIYLLFLNPTSNSRTAMMAPRLGVQSRHFATKNYDNS